MNILLDTQLIIWLYGEPGRVSSLAWGLVNDSRNGLHFSPVSMLEIQIKNAKGRSDFDVDCDKLRLALAATGITELAVNSAHAIAIGRLPMLHKDPFDRLLLAQAMVEDMALLTTDYVLSQYPFHVRNVR